jgi:hypothetical protein
MKKTKTPIYLFLANKKFEGIKVWKHFHSSLEFVVVVKVLKGLKFSENIE